MACGEVCIYACMCGPQSVCSCNVCGPVLLHTWSQLAVNEVPDKPAAAATLETIAHDPDTVGCRALTLGQIVCSVVIAEMMLVSAGSCKLWSVCRFFKYTSYWLRSSPNEDKICLVYDLGYVCIITGFTESILRRM